MPRLRTAAGVLATAAAAAFAAPILTQDHARTPPPVDFTYQVRPLLSDRCFRCHGPDAGKRKAELRLDIREGALKPLEDEGWAIVKPGEPDKSELVRRIHSYLDDDVMPPADAHLSLSDEEKALLTRWVAEGADYRPHAARLLRAWSNAESPVDCAA